MYTGLLHSHRTFVILFLLLYLVKLIMLLANKEEALANLTKKTRIPEMVISVLFLATGGWMLAKVAVITPMLWIKMAMVFASIPIAIIGFRKGNKLLAALSVLLIIGAYGLAEMNKVGVDETPLATTVVSDASADAYDQMAHGKALYERNCIVCHGPNGDMQGSGAKNLITSELSEAEARDRIVNGKNAMVGYGEIYSEEEIDAVHAYVLSLRK